MDLKSLLGYLLEKTFGFRPTCISVMVWSAADKDTLFGANYMEIGTLILKGIENMNITSKECYHQLVPDLKICRIVNSMGQVSGEHGYINYELANKDMMRYHETGFTSWDLADIYGPAEDLIGKFRLKLSTLKGREELKIQALTKRVPQPRTITRSIVNENIEKSLHRMSH